MNQMSSTEERRVLDNEKLIHYVLHCKFHKDFTNPEYEDIVSVGKIGLVKAAKSYKEERKTTFASYAVTCIQNEILMYFRKQKKSKKDISIEEYTTISKDGKEYRLEEQLEDRKANFVHSMLKKEELIKTIEILFQVLNPKERLVIFYRINGKTQREISEMFQVSRSHISHIEKKARDKIRMESMCLENKDKCLSMKILEETYQFTIKIEDKKKEDKDFWQKISFMKEEPNLKIHYQNGKLIVKTPQSEEYFFIINEIMQDE